MWTDATLKAIFDNDQYTGADGTTYPGNFPKNEIPGLFLVTLADRPDTAINRINDFTINEDHVQVWDSTPLTANEISSRNKAMVPRSVSAYQAKVALLDAGLYDAINTYMTTTATIRDQLAWAQSATFERDAQTIANLKSALNLTDDKLDALFIAASKIKI
jgi:hypothetical protein